MFSIFKKKTPAVTTDLSLLKTDMHSHLLPGIDDGSPNVETSQTLISGLQLLGLQNFITTPHILWDLYKNTNETIATAKQSLLQHLAVSLHNISLNAAAEYFMDDHLSQLLAKKIPLLCIYKNYVLVEFSFVSAPLNWKQQLFQLQMSGYQPVLAHPERYSYFAGNKKIFEEIKSTGCLLQVNLLSVTGYYNKTAQDTARYLADKKMIDFLGTDLHHHRHLDALRNSGAVIMPVIQSLLNAGILQNTLLN
jgi:protein-tyrosine phosphatase